MRSIMPEQNHPWRKVTRCALAAVSVAAVAVTTEALAQPFLDWSIESQKLFATCAETTNRILQQHWSVFRNADISSSHRNYENTRLNQERRQDLDSCRATADA